MDTCSICLDDINETDINYTLSCNHIFHYTCFRDYVYKSKNTFFTDCPNCKQLNINHNNPLDDPTNNLKMLCKIPLKCSCKTLKGLKCKKKPYLFNYGRCYNHNKDVLAKDKHELLLRYINHLLQSDMRSWSTKVTLVDIVKKLLIKFDDIYGIEDIYRYMFMYMADAKHNDINNSYTDKNLIYQYYDLDLPPEDWLNICEVKRVLF
jgi:hypothetical protein